MSLRFDQVLPKALALLSETFGTDLPLTTIVRDSLGQVSLVVPPRLLGGDEWHRLAERANAALEGYSPGSRRVLLSTEDLIDPSDVLESSDRLPVQGVANVWIVDRLMTNQEWLRKPLRTAPRIPTAVAFSIKGGVGRSTAIAVLALHLARKGLRVLVVDLDLEAPGIGQMLLRELPDYGLVDWCVEDLVGQADQDLLLQMLGDGTLGGDAGGKVTIVPAFGAKTEDYIPKLGRAYAPSLDPSGALSGLAARFDSFLEKVAQLTDPPEVVLLDTRAGLHDIGSAVMTQLGAQCFLFARNDRQTWDAYSRLFLHLRKSNNIRWGMDDDDLRWRLKMVAAQLEPVVPSFESFNRSSYELWTQLYDEEVALVPGHNPLADGPGVFSLDDEEAPHHPLRIVHDPQIRSLSFNDLDRQPDWTFLETAFGPFLAGAEQFLITTEE